MPFLLYGDEIFSPTTIGFLKGKMVGHIVLKDGVITDPEKLDTISKLLFPTTKKALRGFLGMVGYYRMFIHMFATKARPLTRFLREDAFALLEDEVSRRAFEQLKLALQVALIFQTPDWNKPFLIYCDAFGEAVGSTLSQLDENGHDHPIHFVSRQLTSGEKNYTVTEQEGLAVIFFLKKFRHYLLGYKVKIVTDHKALTYLVNKPNPSGRLARWLLLMEEFDIDIVHRPGRRHDNVDGLIRAYEGVGDVSEDDDFLDVTIMSINAEEAPEEYREIVQYLDGMRFPDGATKAVRTRIAHKSWNYSMIGGQLYFQGRDGVLRRTIGKRDTSRLLYEFHDEFCGGHFAGRIIAEKILQASYYWPTLFKDAHDYCRSCDVCQAYAQRSTVSGPLHPIPPLGPFEKWGIDLMGPLLMIRRGH
jgi:hypothetical protein